MGRRNKKGRPVHGWVCVDKPAGMGSTKVVGMVRHAFNAQKAGHAGTLDPLATGILAIALGEATKTVPYAMDTRKTYRFIVRWGEQRSTDDPEGEVVATSDHRPSKQDIEAVLPEFEGDIEQVPPKFSAIKVQGARAYDLARDGEQFELKSRIVHVEKLRLVDIPDADQCVLEMVSGKGAYVRSLARDLGVRLNTCAHASDIRRTAVGPFNEDNAISLDKLTEFVHNPVLLDHLLPVETPLDDIPAMAISGTDAARVRRGQAILVRNGPANPAESIICATSRGKPVALGHVEAGEFKPVRVFNLPVGVSRADVDYA